MNMRPLLAVATTRARGREHVGYRVVLANRAAHQRLLCRERIETDVGSVWTFGGEKTGILRWEEPLVRPCRAIPRRQASPPSRSA